VAEIPKNFIEEKRVKRINMHKKEQTALIGWDGIREGKRNPC